MSDHVSVDPAARLTEHSAFLERLARRLVLDGGAAEDLVQEAYAAALGGKGRAPRDLRKWLAGAVRNLARAEYRADERRRRRETAVAAIRGAAVPGPDAIAARLETQTHLLAAVQDLAEPYRSVVVHRFYDDRTPAEIAEILGVPASTVRTRLARALAMLRGRLDDRTGGDRAAWCVALLATPRPDRAAAAGGVGATTVSAALVALMSKKAVAVLAVLVALLVGWTLLTTLFSPDADEGDTADVQTPDDGAAGRRLRDRTGASDSPRADDATALNDTVEANAGTPGATSREPDRERDLFGIVVDEAGSPIAGARVETVFHPWRRGDVLSARTDTVAGPATESGPDGTFLVSLTRGAEVELRVSASGFAGVSLVQRQAGERVRVVLSRGFDLTATVTDARGVGVAGAVVTAGRALPGEAVKFRREATTDESGRAVLRALPPGVAEVRAAHPVDGRAQRVSASIGPGEPNAVELRVVATRDLVGRVLDATTRAPITGAEVGEGWRRLRAVTTDDAGRFLLHGWSRASGDTLFAAAPGYGSQQMLVPPSGEIVVELARGDVVTGRIVGRAGEAVPGASVVLVGSRHTDEGQEIDSLSTLTDAGGRFRLDAARRDLAHLLLANAPGHGPLRHDVVPRAEGPGEVDLGDLTLPPARRVSGVVVDADGAPLPDVDVSLRALAASATRGIYGVTESRRTDDLGRFAFADIGPGDYELRAVFAGGAPVSQRLRIAPDADPEAVTLAFAAGGRLRVRVFDAAGAPIPGAWVAPDLPGFRDPPRTDAEGRAELQGLPGESVTFWVIPPRGSADGRRFLQRRIVAARVGSDDEVRVELIEAQRIAGRVDGPDDRPLARVFVRAVADDGTDAEAAVTDDRGWFELFVPPGRSYRVFVDGTRPVAGSPVVVESIPVAGQLRVAPPAADVVLRTARVAADRTLSVHVTSVAGDPVAGIVVRLQSAAGAPIESDDAPTATTDAGGVARFSALTPQAVRVYVGDGPVAGGARPAPVEVVPAGQTLETRCRPAAVVVGVVRRRSGEPAARASVWLGGMDGVFLDRGVTTADGRFELAGVADTALQLHAYIELDGGLTEQARAFDVRAGMDIELDLE